MPEEADSWLRGQSWCRQMCQVSGGETSYSASSPFRCQPVPYSCIGLSLDLACLLPQLGDHVLDAHTLPNLEASQVSGSGVVLVSVLQDRLLGFSATAPLSTGFLWAAAVAGTLVRIVWPHSSCAGLHPCSLGVFLHSSKPVTNSWLDRLPFQFVFATRLFIALTAASACLFHWDSAVMRSRWPRSRCPRSLWSLWRQTAVFHQFWCVVGLRMLQNKSWVHWWPAETTGHFSRRARPASHCISQRTPGTCGCPVRRGRRMCPRRSGWAVSCCGVFPSAGLAERSGRARTPRQSTWCRCSCQASIPAVLHVALSFQCLGASCEARLGCLCIA